MTHKTTQREQIEHLLRAQGSVHTFELRRIFIGNPSQRIAELEARGWQFQHRDEKLNGDAYGTRYVPLNEPDPTSGSGRGEGPPSDAERNCTPGVGHSTAAPSRRETVESGAGGATGPRVSQGTGASVSPSDPSPALSRRRDNPKPIRSASPPRLFDLPDETGHWRKDAA